MMILVKQLQIRNFYLSYSSLISRKYSLQEAYIRTKQLYESKKLPPDVNKEGVFTCNQLDLEEIQVYGFDYDYTLACYKPAMGDVLYNLGRNLLLDKYKYPADIMQLPYDPQFAIRGLHYDIEKGLLMKLDSFLQISSGTVYRGLSPVPDEQVLDMYRSWKIPFGYINPQQYQSRSQKMMQLADLFSVPEICLLCNVAEYFERHQIDYNPEILFLDVKNSIGQSHLKMHEMVMEATDTFLEKNDLLRMFFQRLSAAGKKLFLITNSPFNFVDKGMQVLVGRDWEEFFDVIIVQARKPKFFTDESCPIRLYDKTTGANLWDRVTSLRKGQIYYQGTIKTLLEMTSWRGPEVLYFGDHPYSDLADVTLEHGWRTAAIIHELTHEINTLNNPEFKKSCNWLQMLTQLIEEQQDNEQEPNAAVELAKWQSECVTLRNCTKSVFNKQFGSVFRTHHNPTYFSRRLFRFADVYTSSITNFLNYSLKHTFYPRRGAMPHEYSSYFV